jgi:hypothetical protein
MPRKRERSYAVVWSDDVTSGSGRLEVLRDRFELYGRDRRLSILFSELTAAAINRGARDRLRGLPVLTLTTRSGAPLRIASLEGAGALHELAARIAYTGLSVAPALSGI